MKTSMKYFQFKKLVRDKIVDNMKEENQNPKGVRILEDKEYLEELKTKLIEEVEEFEAVTNEKEMVEELADVQEVIEYIKKVLKIKDVDFEKYQKKKIKKSGGFKKRIYLESVGIKEDSKWFKYFQKNPDKYPPIKKPE